MKSKIALKDLILILLAMMVMVGGAVAYAHTQFAYRDEVKEIRQMVYDLWMHEGLDKKGKNDD